MPEGYGVPETDEGLLDWSWAVTRLESALNYWFATTRSDGRPHAMPAWAVWLDGALYFEGSPMTRRARNLAANPAVVVHLESGDDVVILEGDARDVGLLCGREAASRLADENHDRLLGFLHRDRMALAVIGRHRLGDDLARGVARTQHDGEPRQRQRDA